MKKDNSFWGTDPTGECKKTAIFEYIKERVTGMKGLQKVGVIVGFVSNGGSTIRIGFSKANLKAGDKFDLEYGIDLAIERACKWVPSVKLPVHLVGMMKQFEERCLKYFQQAESIVPYNSQNVYSALRKTRIDKYLDLERRFMVSKGKDVTIDELIQSANNLMKSGEIDWLLEGGLEGWLVDVIQKMINPKLDFDSSYNSLGDKIYDSLGVGKILKEMLNLSNVSKSKCNGNCRCR